MQLVSLNFLSLVSSVVIFTHHCSVFVLSGRTKCNITESIIGHAVCCPEMTFDQIYLEMANSVVSSRFSGAARPG